MLNHQPPDQNSTWDGSHLINLSIITWVLSEWLICSANLTQLCPSNECLVNIYQQLLCWNQILCHEELPTPFRVRRVNTEVSTAKTLNYAPMLSISLRFDQSLYNQSWSDQTSVRSNTVYLRDHFHLNRWERETDRAFFEELVETYWGSIKIALPPLYWNISSLYHPSSAKTQVHPPEIFSSHYPFTSPLTFDQHVTSIWVKTFNLFHDTDELLGAFLKFNISFCVVFHWWRTSCLPQVSEWPQRPLPISFYLHANHSIKEHEAIERNKIKYSYEKAPWKKRN